VKSESTPAPRLIAFLRAINVGGHVVKMEALRRIFESLDFADVETFIASGNVIFSASEPASRALEGRIETALQEALGYAVATFIRSTPELAAIVGYEPFPAADLAGPDVSLFIGFLPEPPDTAAERTLAALASAGDEFHLHGRELYWLRRGRISDSPVTGAVLEKKLRLPTTLRNATTVRKLAAKYPPPD
jgi:uncharacterized protein (DUF1697 family)